MLFSLSATIQLLHKMELLVSAVSTNHRMHWQSHHMHVVLLLVPRHFGLSQ